MEAKDDGLGGQKEPNVARNVILAKDGSPQRSSLPPQRTIAEHHPPQRTYYPPQRTIAAGSPPQRTCSLPQRASLRDTSAPAVENVRPSALPSPQRLNLSAPARRANSEK